MRLSVYGKKIIEVIQEESQWAIYEVGEGKRIRLNDVVIPSHYAEAEVIIFLEDLYHEAASVESPEIKRLK